ASFLNSFPLLLDDTQKGMEKIIKDTIYHFSSGEEKGRGNTKAIDEIKRWNNILLSTGENSISSYTDNKGGAGARAVTIEAPPFEEINFKKLYAGMEDYHGSLALALYEQYQADIDYYKKAFRDFESDFIQKAGDNEVVKRLGRSFAIIKLAGLVLDNVQGFATDFDGVCEYVYQDMLENNKAIDKPKQVLDE